MIIDANGKSPFEIRDSTGKEFKKIYDADGNLLFKNWNTIQGTPPIVFKGYNRSLKNYKIYGNTIQDGTPTPETPVEVQGCGVRTRNLFDCDIEQGTISVNGILQVTNSRVRANGFITLDVGTYTLNAVAKLALDTFIFKYKMDGTFEERIPLEWTQMPYTFNMSERQMIKIVFAKHPANNYYKIKPEEVSDIMLNAGSTALPYEPYGYKLPVTISNGVFLDEPLRGIGEYKDTLDLSTGVVTRRIKKLVLTGEERWTLYNGNYYSSVTDRYSLQNMPCRCTHTTGEIIIDNGSVRLKVFASRVTTVASNLEEWKSYLTAQYANGTPVTIWYILAEPETETVSVPSGLSGIIEGYCIQDGTPTPENPIEVVSNGTVQSDGTYLVPRTAQFITTPIYIGSEPLHKIDDYADYIDFERGVVVRRIKKLVLTGEESITKAASNPVFTMQLNGSNTPFSENAVTTLSTHYQAQNNVAGTGNVNDMSVCVRRGYGTMYIGDARYDNTTDFKSYLAAQYTAGTPVTVWYVLAEPEETPLSDLDPITPLKGVNTLSTNATIQPSEIYLKGKIKSLATHMLVDSSGNILLTSNNYQLVTKEE